ncbi:MAG TPA: formate/nitrite transporter family protein [Hyphomicrobiaceae bacterium]|jgi:formate/nitrite transporter
MQQPVDIFEHGDIAARLEAVSVKRAALPLRSLLILGLLGGIYIGFGGAFATLALTDSQLGFGPAKLAAGGAFSLGLVLLVIAGGELFTGNNLMFAALASGEVSARALWRNWSVSYAANAAGALLLAGMIHHSGVLDGGGMKATAVKIAEAKAQLGFGSAFLRGLLCNMLVCLAVWLSLAARSIEGKVLAIVFPITAFVALGFEHCIANLYLIPVGVLSGAHITGPQFVGNVVAVTLGNTVGGAALAGAYWLALLRDGSATAMSLRIRRMRTAAALRVACKMLRLAPRAR